MALYSARGTAGLRWPIGDSTVIQGSIILANLKVAGVVLAAQSYADNFDVFGGENSCHRVDGGALSGESLGIDAVPATG